MKPNTFVATQFALFGFFFSNLIPFAGDILLPVIWLYDRRITLAYLVINAFQNILPMYGAMQMLQARFPHNPVFASWVVVSLAEVAIAIGILEASIVGGFWLKRKIRKYSPDLQRIMRR